MAAATCLLAMLGCGTSPPPHIVLVSFDTLRADFLGAYGHRGGTSPNIDAFAEGGTVFQSALSVSSWTRPAHFSMLTGLYPDRRMATYRHDHNDCRVQEGVLTLAELLSDAGYETAAFTGGGYIHDQSGFEQGFDVFVSHGRRFEDNVAALYSWLERPHDKPLFLFLHCFNVHRPYAAPQAYIDRFVPNPPTECSGVDFSLEHDWVTCVNSDGGPEYLKGLYAAEVAYVDEQFGEFVMKFGQHYEVENTIFVLTSDHGDELLERGKLDHIRTLYGELVNVPLILRGPRIPAGHRVDTEVGIVDILPTLLDLAGVKLPEAIDGTSLRPHLGISSSGLSVFGGKRSADPRRFALSGWRPEDRWGQTNTFTASVVSGGQKLICNEGDDGVKFELYDLDRDPLEKKELLGAGDELPAIASDLLNWIDDRARRTYCEEQPLSDRVKEQLKALGYADP